MTRIGSSGVFVSLTCPLFSDIGNHDDGTHEYNYRHGAYWGILRVGVFFCGQVSPVARKGRAHDEHGHVEPETLPEIFHALTSPWSGRRDLNPRLSRWQRDALPLVYPCILLSALYVGRQVPGDNIWRCLRQCNTSGWGEKPVDPFSGTSLYLHTVNGHRFPKETTPIGACPKRGQITNKLRKGYCRVSRAADMADFPRNCAIVATRGKASRSYRV